MIENEIKSILTSYAETGITNTNLGQLYPPKKRIVELLELIKELLFPGFFGAESLNETKLKTLTADRVNHLHESLTMEIERCLRLEKDRFTKQKKDLTELSSEFSITFLRALPKLRKTLKLDAEAMYKGDPAAKSVMEVLLSYPGFLAVMIYRVAHYFYTLDIPLIPRMMTEMGHHLTGIDIHPGAKIGNSFCIDHGTGIVIGETAEIGNFVKLYQGVTLGAFSVKKNDALSKRHPTLKDHVTVYSMSTILGGDTIVGAHAVVGGNVWLTHSISDHSKIYLAEDHYKRYKLVEPDAPNT